MQRTTKLNKSMEHDRIAKLRKNGRGGQNGSASNAPCVCGQDEYNEGNNRNFRHRNLSREYSGVFKGCTHVSCLPA